MTCVPLPTPSSPDVVDPVGVEGAGAAAPCPVGAVLSVSPRTDTALPVTVIGALTASSAWLPESTPSRPFVVTRGAPADGSVWGAELWGVPAGALVVDVSVTLTALFDTVTGRLTVTAA